MERPDAIVVGSGPNGLAAALTLARAGHAVEVYEGAPTLGGGTRTEEVTLEGFRHDVCAAVHPTLVASPFFRSLDLSALGVVLRQPEVPFAHPLRGGRAAALYRDIWDACLRRNKPRVETGWILEINEPMNRAMEALTGRIVKRYRLYERLLEADAAPAFPGSSS